MIDDDASPNSSSIVPVALAVLAVAVGGVGLYFGITANQRLTAFEDQIDKTVAAAVAGARSDVDGRLKEAVASSAKAQSDVEALRINMRMNLNQMTGKLEEVIARLGEIQQLAVGGAGAAPASPSQGGGSAPAAPAVSGSGGSGSDGPAPGAASTSLQYQIKGGDTFQKIADANGLSVQAIIDANPGVDPRRLAIGQVIKLPAPR